MSATGRNLDGNERHAGDFYETPGWATRAILPHLGTPRTVLDAGAGSGAILREVCTYWPKAFSCGLEINSDLVAAADRWDITRRSPGKILLGDFLGEALKHFAPFNDLVIANPPYSLAEAFAERALQIGKTVAFLLRINWLASKRRAAFHRAHPADLYVLPRRPSFTKGGTDATEYAWFVWGEAAMHPTCTHRQPAAGNRWFLLDCES